MLLQHKGRMDYQTTLQMLGVQTSALIGLMAITLTIAFILHFVSPRTSKPMVGCSCREACNWYSKIQNLGMST